MSVFIYTAREELAPGTVDLSLVTREFRLLTTRHSRKPIARRNTSLDGSVESLMLRREKHYSCQTQLLEPTGLPEAHVIEFFASVENAEDFTFDRYGTIAVPDKPVSCIMVSTSLGAIEKGKAFNQYAFVIREA